MGRQRQRVELFLLPDTVNNGACDTSWVSVGAATTAQISALAGGTTYYWQVRASNAAGSIDADSGTWWSFATGAAGRVQQDLRR